MAIKTLDGTLDKGNSTRGRASLNVDKGLLSRFFAALAKYFPHVEATAAAYMYSYNVSNKCSLGFHGFLARVHHPALGEQLPRARDDFHLICRQR